MLKSFILQIFMIQNRKYFEDASLSRGPGHFEYQNYEVETDNALFEKYEVISKIGRGKYSDVFKCINIDNDKLYVLKFLKPVYLVRDSKIKREIKILRTLKGMDNIINLQGVTYDGCSSCYCLIYPYVNHSDIRDLTDTELTQSRIKSFIVQVLQALQNSHRMGIMHRDIKPQNILYDKDEGKVFVADWGLADYYLPERQYNVRVASRHYKGPQLLLNHKYYGYSLDIWSLGCLLAGLIFGKSIFFRGDNNPDQMRVILEHAGTEQVEKYIKKYKIRPDREVLEIIREKNRPFKPWEKYINGSNEKLATKQVLDLLTKMLTIDHQLRINCTEALKHPYLQPS